MPAIQPPAKILVTGANGYIAAWLVRTLIEKGYTVRGTVRSAEKGKIFDKYGDKFELVVVPDITKEGAFDEAVKGVDAIEHTASPFHFNADDPEELITPAVKGTVGILQSAFKNGTNVKRVVVTSSCASVLQDLPEAKVLTEADWNEQAIETIEKLGRKAPAGAKYRASKTLAEKAAWKFVEENKGSIKWDLVCLNPPFVFGPAIHDVSEPTSLGTSAKNWYETVVTPTSGGKSVEDLAAPAGSWIDVRDVAEAHAVALEKEAAGGERIIITPEEFVWQEWLDIANSITPTLLPNHTLPKGVPGAGRDAKFLIKYDTSKAAKILGLKYKTKEETTRDTLADFAEKGW